MHCVRPALTSAAIGLFAAAANAQVQPGKHTIQLVEVASGLTSPVQITHAGDGSGRLFIVDQAGLIRIVENGVLLPTPFLDVTAAIPVLHPGFDERGLLGVAFHPDYENNGRFFVRHSVPRAGTAGEPCFGTSRGCHKEVLMEFDVSANPNVADPNGTLLFEVDEPEFNHNGGGIAFGPDGFLYFTLGDGGGAHDGLAANPPAHGPIGNGQNIETVLGSILRIDVDGAFPYAIPPTNPFPNAMGQGQPEIYAYGMRNPYRFSFDDGPGGTGDLWLADVGQNLFEEINIVELGGNYGWVIREGFHCFDPFNPTMPPAMCPTTGPHGEPLLDPIAEYDHTEGISVIGGFVYRGDDHPNMQGLYVFGDFSTGFGTPDGRLFYIDTNGTLSEIFEFRIGALNTPLGFYLLGFGEDEEGEIYVGVTSNLAPTGTTGRVFRLFLDNCYANCDGSSGPGVLDLFDFLCFVNAFNNNDPYADCDGNTILDLFDFLCFVNAFNGGCP